MLPQIKQELLSHADQQKAAVYARFFKTGKGEYGEGDIFLGLTVPEQRKIAQKYIAAPLAAVQKLLESKYHEFRLTGFFILVYKFQRQPSPELVDFYIQHKARANNWDLIDCVADKILGTWLLDKDNEEKSILYELARSDSLWDRRIAIISTFAFIKNRKFEDTLRIAEILLHDDHDLIHKSVGWMLREVGKRDQSVLEGFLKRYSPTMPRTMLRYAIEKFDAEKREFYLRKENPKKTIKRKKQQKI